MSSGKRLPVGVRRRENSDGTSSFQARWRDRSGTQHARTFDTAREASNHLDDLRQRMRRGASGDPTAGQITFAEQWDWWQDTRDVADSTMARDLFYGRNRILPHWSEFWLVDIRHEDVQDWKKIVVASNISPATAHKVVNLYKRCLAAVVDADRLMVSPAANIMAPPIPMLEAVHLDPEEPARLAAAIEAHWYLVEPFMVDTALRIGEVAALRVSGPPT